MKAAKNLNKQVVLFQLAHFSDHFCCICVQVADGDDDIADVVDGVDGVDGVDVVDGDDGVDVVALKAKKRPSCLFCAKMNSFVFVGNAIAGRAKL